MLAKEIVLVLALQPVPIVAVQYAMANVQLYVKDVLEHVGQIVETCVVVVIILAKVLVSKLVVVAV